MRRSSGRRYGKRSYRGKGRSKRIKKYGVSRGGIRL